MPKFKLFLSFFICLLTSSIGISSEAISNQQIYKVKFDYASYSTEREIVYQYLMNKNKNENIKKEQIGIDLYDIDSDGKKEILVYLNDAGYCGTAGCTFEILKLKENQDISFLSWNDDNQRSINTQEDIVVLKSTTNNVHDLLFNGKELWQWHGRYFAETKLK